MKGLIIIAFTLLASSAFAREINLTGLKAKALYSSLDIDHLDIFRDGGMGKRYIEIGPIDCFKSMVVDNEFMGCTFKSKVPSDNVTITLGSTNSYQEVGEIRFALGQATKSEVQSETRKDLKVKSVSCKYSGYGHVLDSMEIEVKYDCKITL